MRRLGIAFLIFVGVLGLAWVVLPKLISKDMLRSRLEMTLSDRLGRSVAIGDVSFGLRPLPRIRATDLHVGRSGAPEGDQEISARSLDLALALRPLFRREIEVVEASVDGLAVDVYLPAEGVDPDASSRGREAEGAGPRDGGPGGAAAPADPPAGRSDGGSLNDGDPAGKAGSGGNGTTAAPGVTVRIESLVLNDARVRVIRGEEEVLSLDRIHEVLTADVAVDGVIRYSGRTEIPVWKLTTPTGSFGHGLPVVLEKSLRFDPAAGRLRIESAQLELAGLPIALEGTASGLGTSSNSRTRELPVLDLTFSGGPSRIESIVGLLPSSWVSRTGGIRSSGGLEVHGDVRGPVGAGAEPDFSLAVSLVDGRLEGGELPAAVESLIATLQVGPKAVIVESLSARSQQSSLTARGRIDDYRGTPRIDIAVDGSLDLALVTALQKRTSSPGVDGKPVPELSGRAEIQAVVRGTLPPGGDPAKTIEPLGTVTLLGVDVRGIDSPIEGLSGKAVVRGRTLQVNDVAFRMGESDIEVDGEVDDFWALDPRGFGRPGVTRSKLVVRSRLLDLDSLAPPPPGTTKSGSSSGEGGVDTEALGSSPGAAAAAPSGFEVFAGFLSRLDGPIQIGIETVRVRQLDWKDVEGVGAIDRGQVRIDALDLHVFGGLLATTGTIDLSAPKRPVFDLDLRAEQLEASRFFTDNPGLSKLSGLGGFVEGAVDLTAEANGALDDTFQLELKTLTSLGNLEMEGGKISGHPIQTALATYLGQSDLKMLPIHDWLQPFRIRNGRVEFEEVLIKAGDFTFSGSGWTSIDGGIGLEVDLLVPPGRTDALRSKLPKVAADILLGQAGEAVLLPITVSGTATKPTVQLDESRLTDRARSRAAEQLDAERRKLEEKLQAEKDALQRRLEDEARRKARDAIGGLLPGAAADSSRVAVADTTATKLEEEVKGLLKGIFKKR